MYSVFMSLIEISRFFLTYRYVCDNKGKSLTYKLNGAPVLVLSVLVFVVGAHFKLFQPTYLYNNYARLIYSGKECTVFILLV